MIVPEAPGLFSALGMLLADLRRDYVQTLFARLDNVSMESLQTTTVWERSELLAGNVIAGPAVIEESASTTVVEPGDVASVNSFGHLVIKLRLD